MPSAVPYCGSPVGAPAGEVAVRCPNRAARANQGRGSGSSDPKRMIIRGLGEKGIDNWLTSGSSGISRTCFTSLLMTLYRGENGKESGGTPGGYRESKKKPLSRLLGSGDKICRDEGGGGSCRGLVPGKTRCANRRNWRADRNMAPIVASVAIFLSIPKQDHDRQARKRRSEHE
jgi:hypothetical protein